MCSLQPCQRPGPPAALVDITALARKVLKRIPLILKPARMPRILQHRAAFRKLAQQSLEFAVRHLDRIKVGRVLRQVANCRLRFLDCLSDSWDFVGSQVIHHYDIVSAERRNQALLDLGEERLSAHGSVDHHWRGHFIVTPRGHEGDCLPCAKRDAADQPDPARSPPPEPHHVGAGRSLVDKHQPGGIKLALLADPTSPRAGHIGSLPFRGLQAFFLRVTPCRSRNRQSELRLVRIRCLRLSNIRIQKSSSGDSLRCAGALQRHETP